MTTLTYNPAGNLVSTSKNLSGFLYQANKRGVSNIKITAVTGGGGDVVITYIDGFYSSLTFASLDICRAFISKRFSPELYRT